MGADLQEDYRKNLEWHKKKKRSIRLLTVAAVAVLLAIAAAAGWHVMSRKGAEKRYAAQMDEGNRYLIQLNYEEAEIAYEKAIAEAPGEPEAYEKLAYVYMAQNRYEEAGRLLETGIHQTNSQTLVKTYQRVSAMLQNMKENGLHAETVTADQLLRLSEHLTLDASIYDVVASYTYEAYVAAYGEPVSATENAYNGRDVRFNGFPGTVSFRKASYENSRADAVSFENLSDLLGNYEGAADAGKLKELFGSEMSVMASGEEEEPRYYVSFTYHGCVVMLASDAQGNVYGNAANVLSPVQDTDSAREEESAVEDTQGQRRASGYIINAVNGGGVSASIRFLNGGRYGTVERETATQRDGSFEAQLKPGQYTLEIRATGFITSYEEIVVNAAGDLKGLSFTLSPELETGEIRIVLTWGAMPRDLDSHLEGTSSGGESVNVSFRHMKAGEMVVLDIDDMSGYGPETTTIYDAGGSYTFRVHNYSAYMDSVSLAESGAVVKVYLSGQAEPEVFEVPSGAGIWWDVCRIENGGITALQTLHD